MVLKHKTENWILSAALIGCIIKGNDAEHGICQFRKLALTSHKITKGENHKAWIYIAFITIITLETTTLRKLNDTIWNKIYKKKV